MRIGIDYRPCLKPGSRRRGIGRFTSQLVSHLLAADKDNSYTLYSIRGQRPQETPHQAAFVDLPYLARPSRLNWLLDRFTLPRRLRRDRLQLFHATEHTSAPVSRETAVWAYVHDLIPYLFWEQTRRHLPADFRYALSSAVERVRQAAMVVTVSRHSRRDLCRHWGLEEDKVKVLYQDCHPALGPVEEARAKARLQEKYGISGHFLFYLGGTDFRKNLPALVEAFAQLAGRGYRGSLVMAGESFAWDIPEVQEVRARVVRHGLESRVLFPGYVPDADLGHFYSACQAFVFPSLYEGFGIPLLEAMRCGAPAVAAQAASLPEVGGEAARYFDPADSRSIADALWEVLEDPVLRVRMGQQGLERSRQFSWARSAERLCRWQKEALR
ncbi:MAG TPA: glycosyltransferase family 1 protein [Acidobacteriota bacterium]|nr:glycosyltransferase family 1 protein [Acidobacteriota bacterium]